MTNYKLDALATGTGTGRHFIESIDPYKFWLPQTVSKKSGYEFGKKKQRHTQKTKTHKKQIHAKQNHPKTSRKKDQRNR